MPASAPAPAWARAAAAALPPGPPPYPAPAVAAPPPPPPPGPPPPSAAAPPAPENMSAWLVVVVLILMMSMPTVHKRECLTVQKAQGQTWMIAAKHQRPVLSARTSVTVPTRQTSLWLTVLPCKVLPKRQTRQAVVTQGGGRTVRWKSRRRNCPGLALTSSCNNAQESKQVLGSLASRPNAGTAASLLVPPRRLCRRQVMDRNCP